MKTKVQRDVLSSTEKRQIRLQSAKTQASSANVSLCFLPPHSKICFVRTKLPKKETKAEDMSTQNHPENFNEILKSSDDRANINATLLSQAKQLTADPSLSLSAAENNWRPIYACIAQSKHCNISKQPRWTWIQIQREEYNSLGSLPSWWNSNKKLKVQRP